MSIAAVPIFSERFHTNIIKMSIKFYLLTLFLSEILRWIQKITETTQKTLPGLESMGVFLFRQRDHLFSLYLIRLAWSTRSMNSRTSGSYSRLLRRERANR